MKTPSPQEAAKMTNRQIASEIATDCVNAIGAMALPIALKREPEAFDLCGKIERALDAKDAALLEADKNGYERGRTSLAGVLEKHNQIGDAIRRDEALLRECLASAENSSCDEMCGTDSCDCGLKALTEKLRARLTPSGSVSDAKEPQ